MRFAFKAALDLVLIITGGILMPGCTSFYLLRNADIKKTWTVEPFSSAKTETARLVDHPNPLEGTDSVSFPIPGLPFEPLSVDAINCDYGGIFKTIEAVDEYTVRFTLCKPEVAFLSKIAFPTFGIQSREWLERIGEDGGESQLLDVPVGTGPFRVHEWTHGERLVFETYEDYWDETKAQIPKLVFRWNLDEADRLLELQAGTVDGIDNVSSTDFPTILNDPDLILVPRSPLSISYLGMNNTTPPFDNENVRQAIAMAIDRRKLVDTAFPKGYEVASHFTPCIIPNGCAGETWYEYNPGQARELLVEAGFPNGFKTELIYRDVVRGYLPEPGSVAEEIRDQLWDNLSIDLKTRKLGEVDFYNAIDAGGYPGLYLLGWGAGFPDVTDFLDSHFGLNASGQFGGKYSDIVEALDSGRKISNSDARLPFYEAANNAIRLHTPMVPISYGGWVSPDSLAVAYKRDVNGAHASPLGLEGFLTMAFPGQETFIWMQSTEPLSLYCADETDIETWRACAQVTESLYRFSVGGTTVEPALAELCQPNGELTVWTCTLHKNVMFHDRSMLDANDVVMSFIVQWDASSSFHKGNTGSFEYFKEFWGEFINSPYP